MSNDPSLQVSYNQNNLGQLNGINQGGKKSLLSQRIYRDTGANPTYLTFKERVEQSPYLVSLEDKASQNVSKKSKKKEIISYIANRDKLFIPKPERPRLPINIDKNLIEEEKKVVTADLGIQSDKIDYVNPEKPYLPQKSGKDQGTQIMDGDLFNFDHDVQPLLTVIVGKTLEQAMNEIEQEDEIATLREAKAMYLHKNNEEKKRIRNLEDREIQKKFNNDAKKEKRKQEREKRKNTQRELISRVISKAYLKNLYKNSIKDLIMRGHFRNYTQTVIKNTTNSIIKSGSESLSNMFINMRNYLSTVLDNQFKKKLSTHSAAVQKHRELLQQQKEERERRKKEEEERKIQEDLARKERRRQRKIERIRKEIKATIIDTGVVKGEAYGEEITEIDNYMKSDAPYIGVYGGLFGMLISTLSLIRRDFYTSETLYTSDNIEEILSMVFNDCQGSLNIHFTQQAADEVREILKKSMNTEDEEEEEEKKEIDLSALKTMNDLDMSTWEKISAVLEKIEYNNDYILKHLIEELSKAPEEKEDGTHEEAYLNSEFYSLIIKALISMCSKSNYLDHFNLIFDSEASTEEGEEEKEEDDGDKKKEPKVDLNTLTFEERIARYEAVCMIEMAKPSKELINEVEYTKPGRKKSVKAPDFDSDITTVKAYTNLPNEHNVLLYDRVTEFLIRNKIFELALSHFSFVMNTEPDSQPMFITFNETYDTMIENSKICSLIQVYHYPPDVEQPENTEGQENQES